MAAIRANEKYLQLKVEGTYNTDPTPTAASNSLLVYDLSHTDKIEKLENSTYHPVMLKNPDYNNVYGRDISFSIPVKEPTSAGDTPELADILRACGLTQSIDAGVQVVYQANSSIEGDSCTVHIYEDTIKYITTGCRGNIKFNFEAGKKIMAEVTLMGFRTTPSDSTSPTSITLDSNDQVLFQDLIIVLNGDATLPVYAATIDLGNELIEMKDGGSSYGRDAFGISNRNINGTIQVRQEFLDGFNPYTVLDAGTNAGDLSITHSNTGQSVQWIVKAVQFDSVTENEVDGVKVYDIAWTAASSGYANTEYGFSMIFGSLA